MKTIYQSPFRSCSLLFSSLDKNHSILSRVEKRTVIGGEVAMAEPQSNICKVSVVTEDEPTFNPPTQKGRKEGGRGRGGPRERPRART